MKHDSHFQCYRIHCAKESLGTRYILHKNHAGGISHNPASVNVLKTIKRVGRIRKEQREADRKASESKLAKRRIVAA